MLTMRQRQWGLCAPTASALTLAAMRRKNKENCPSIRQDETNRTESKVSPSGKAVENQKDKEGKP